MLQSASTVSVPLTSSLPSSPQIPFPLFLIFQWLPLPFYPPSLVLHSLTPILIVTTISLSLSPSSTTLLIIKGN